LTERTGSDGAGDKDRSDDRGADPVGTVDSLKSQVERLPDRPGVYLFKDAAGHVIYVGKARSLRSRARSYLQSPAALSDRALAMRERAASVDCVVTDSELEALILECSLIKRHRPKYNVRFVDDKNYPYICVTTEDEYPRVLVARSMKKDGSRYFGPYTRAGAMRETLRLVRRLFPFRTCSDRRLRSGGRPCLYYHIRRCMGPCTGDTDPREYRKMIEELCMFLQGRRADVIARLRRRMQEAADRLQFERAARLRDQLRAVEEVTESQSVVLSATSDLDVIALEQRGGLACAQAFYVRDGVLTDRADFLLEGVDDAGDRRVLAEFLKQHYARASFIPKEVLVQAEPEESDLIQRWLTGRRRGRAKVHIKVPKRGEKRRLLEMARANAALSLQEGIARMEAGEAGSRKALEGLAEALGLPAPPWRIEGYDISNVSGRDAVGSVVVFTGGRPDRDEYRRFRIRTDGRPDDYAMMGEVLERRFRRGLKERQEIENASQEGRKLEGEPKFGRFPDLVVVDGGKGQLGVATRVLESLGLDGIAACALAKRNEELFVQGRPQPVVLDRASPALFLVERLRDEAHRFAVSYHRRVRGKRAVRSVLDSAPGIGPKRKKALLRKFGSVKRIREADVKELAGVPGMTRKAAERLKEHLGG